MSRYERTEREDWEQEHDLKIVWKCPSCSFEYEDYPGVNESQPCPDCGALCRQSGESYC